MTGATLTAKQYKGQDGRLPTSVDRCSLPINVTISNVAQPKYAITLECSNCLHDSLRPNLLLPLYSISYLWYNLNGVLLVVIFGLLGTLVFGKPLSMNLVLRISLLNLLHRFQWSENHRFFITSFLERFFPLLFTEKGTSLIVFNIGSFLNILLASESTNDTRTQRPHLTRSSGRRRTHAWKLAT